jgi:mRNA interferase HicA
MRQTTKPGVIIFPSHGNNEVGKGLEKKLLKQTGIRKQ